LAWSLHVTFSIDGSIELDFGKHVFKNKVCSPGT
jgi:hypothetical protein